MTFAFATASLPALTFAAVPSSASRFTLEACVAPNASIYPSLCCTKVYVCLYVGVFMFGDNETQNHEQQKIMRCC
jgi:hypothetical protein